MLSHIFCINRRDLSTLFCIILPFWLSSASVCTFFLFNESLREIFFLFHICFFLCFYLLATWKMLRRKVEAFFFYVFYLWRTMWKFLSKALLSEKKITQTDKVTIICLLIKLKCFAHIIKQLETKVKFPTFFLQEAFVLVCVCECLCKKLEAFVG